jgi:hypothetical protein
VESDGECRFALPRTRPPPENRHRNQIDDESWVVGAKVTNGLVCIVANSAKFTVLEDDRKLLRENSAALFERSDL